MREITIPTTKNSGGKLNTNSLSRTVQNLFNDSTHAWNISPGALIAIIAAPFVVVLFGVITGLIGKEAYKWFTGEDRFAENMQVFFWVIAFVLGLRVVRNKLHQGDYLFAILYSILCLGIFFIIGEEVSWGQRIFGWDTPDSMKILNKQDETNIHNIHGIGSTIKWLHLVLGAYGTFVPLFVLRIKRTSFYERYREEISLLTPHYTLIPYFFLPFIWRIYRNLFEAPKEYYFAISEFSEVMELIISLAFVLFLFYQNKQIKRQKNFSGKYNGKLYVK